MTMINPKTSMFELVFAAYLKFYRPGKYTFYRDYRWIKQDFFDFLLF